jgi:hypothetical protein
MSNDFKVSSSHSSTLHMQNRFQEMEVENDSSDEEDNIAHQSCIPPSYSAALHTSPQMIQGGHPVQLGNDDEEEFTGWLQDGTADVEHLTPTVLSHLTFGTSRISDNIHQEAQ